MSTKMNRRILSLILCFLAVPSFAAEDESTVFDDVFIQDAIDTAADTSNSVVELKSGTYELSAPVVLKSGITLKGKDTERTIITQATDWEGAALFIVDGLSNVRVRNLMFKAADVAIQFENTSSTDIEITNSIFFLGTENTAIKLLDGSTPLIEHNVFYQNDYAIFGDLTLVPPTFTIKHNIFLENSYVSGQVNEPNFSYNCYWPNVNGLIEMDATSILVDPRFATLDANNDDYDFHLKVGSGCIDAGDESSALKDALDNSILDIGTYGGPNASVYPSPVAFEKIEESSIDGINYSINFSFKPLTAYEVDNEDGGYIIYFGSSSNDFVHTSGTQTSPLEDLQFTTNTDGENTIIIDGFQAPTATAGTPESGEIQAYNQRLDLSWDAVDEVTGYQLVYIGSDGSTDTVDVEDKTSHSFTNLTNGVSYTVSIQTYSQPALFFFVAAYEGLSSNKNESLWSEEFEEKITFGERVLSDSSTAFTATPDELRPYPNLPNEGCFIATATYGSYDAAQVQVFRDFRDSYLLSNSYGTRFVKYYYQYGPIAARFIDEHPQLKPIMQGVLYPYLFVAEMFMGFGLFFGLLSILMCVGLGAFFTFHVFVYLKREKQGAY